MSVDQLSFQNDIRVNKQHFGHVEEMDNFEDPFAFKTR